MGTRGQVGRTFRVEFDSSFSVFGVFVSMTNAGYNGAVYSGACGCDVAEHLVVMDQCARNVNKKGRL